MVCSYGPPKGPPSICGSSESGWIPGLTQTNLAVLALCPLSTSLWSLMGYRKSSEVLALDLDYE